MRGKALEAGAQGDIINVLNVQSKRTDPGHRHRPRPRQRRRAAPPRLAANTTTSQSPSTPQQRARAE